MFNLDEIETQDVCGILDAAYNPLVISDDYYISVNVASDGAEHAEQSFGREMFEAFAADFMAAYGQT